MIGSSSQEYELCDQLWSIISICHLLRFVLPVAWQVCRSCSSGGKEYRALACSEGIR
jgi:hypothetical protein